MAEWKRTPEPYIKVYERVRVATLNPTAGEDLIIGVALISDAGPSTPTLITSQSEFLSTYASQDLTQEYLESLNELYKGADKTTAATMWANAYRLAGSNTMLCVRASKAEGLYFAKPLVKGDLNTYILRDGELLKKVGPKKGPAFKLVLDIDADDANHDQDGWSINVNGVGIFGNRTTDDGAQYDYFVRNLPDLVEKLNETSKFFSPSYDFFADVKGEEPVNVDMDNDASKGSVRSVIFNEVYLGQNVLDTTDERCPSGLQYVIACEPDWTDANPDQRTIELNGTAWSGFAGADYYATNVFNSATTLKVRIRRFNHDAVVSKTITDTKELYESGHSPYTVLTSVLDTFTKKGTEEPSDDILYRDFYEVAIFDPSVNDEISFFNIGNILGRGDMEVSEINSLISMIQLNLPDNMRDLNLNYYEYKSDDNTWEEYTKEINLSWQSVDSISGAATFEVYSLAELQAINNMGEGDTCKVSIAAEPIYYIYSEENGWEVLGEYTGTDEPESVESVEDLENITDPQVGDVRKITPAPTVTYYEYVDGGEQPKKTVSTYSDLLAETDMKVDDIYKVTETGKYYKYTSNGSDQLWADLTIDPMQYEILSVSDSDLKKALDRLVLDEVYVTEGLCDLGNTELSYQSYMANIAINDNYFYPVSTVNSTNYMTIANSISKISQNSYKLYANTPWDIDTGTLGWKYYASPAVLYWESVARNRRNNEEFASILGQRYGIMQYQRPACEFNKKSRELLLSKRVNTNYWNVSTQAWNMNDCYTKQNEDTIMSEDGNSRLMIRISKAMPVLLRQFIGRKISEQLCTDMWGVIDYWFKTTILPMGITVTAYQINVPYDEILARKNKVKVHIQCRYGRSLRFIDIVNDAFDVGMPFDAE